MHILIEGIAAGVYTSLDDIQADAYEYLQMEKAVEKLENWTMTDKVEDLAKIFDGISNSMLRKKEQDKEEKEWSAITGDMRSVSEIMANADKIIKEAEEE